MFHVSVYLIHHFGFQTVFVALLCEETTGEPEGFARMSSGELLTAKIVNIFSKYLLAKIKQTLFKYSVAEIAAKCCWLKVVGVHHVKILDPVCENWQ